MPTVSHASLTGADLHEPKGAASAASGTVYVATGSGSGTWTTIAALTGTVGRIEMFCNITVPSGYLECDGSSVSRTTYSDLFTAVTTQQTGTRTNGTTGITGLSDTSSMKVGYYIGGSGITNGTTIAAVPTGTTLTLSANATSTGSGTLIVSPWPLGNGTTTFTLPDLTTLGRHPRSRKAGTGTELGAYFANQNLTHDHGGTNANTSASGNTGNASVDHSHTVTVSTATLFYQGGVTAAAVLAPGSGTTFNTGGQSVTHTHGVSELTHTHGMSGNGGSEARPDGVAFIFAVKY